MKRVSLTIPGRPVRWERPKEDSRKGRKTFRFTSKKVSAAVDRIRDELRIVRRGNHPLWTGPIVIRTLFVFRIPVSWPKVVQEAALDGKVWHISDPDYDQLLKLVMDALKGKLYVDDNQIVGPLPGSAKRYGYPERTEIEVVLLDQPPEAVTPGQGRMEEAQEQQARDLASGRLGRRAIASKSKSTPSPTARAGPVLRRGFNRPGKADQ